jgi:transposase-like protein
MNMTQLQFTLDFDKLKDEVMTSDLSDVMKSTLVILMNQFMEKERDDYIQAASHERSDERRDYRNGYYEREILLKIGRVTLRVPRTRNGGFDTQAFEKYQRCERALLAGMLEMVVHGVSTRKVTQIVKELCGENVSKSLVSSLTEALDPEVKAWNTRPLNAMYYPYIYADATYIKVRENGRIVSKGVYIALGVNYKGKREILGMHVGSQESTYEWTAFFNTLKSRGLKTPELLISDAHEGLKSATATCLTGGGWQRCTAHFLRNITSKMPRKGSEEARAMVKAVFKADDLEGARARCKTFYQTFGQTKGYTEAAKCLEDGFDEATQFYANAKAETRKRIKSTNVLERLNSEIKRRTRVIRIFPNDQSALRLIGAVLMDYEETFDRAGYKYIDFQ